MRKKIVGFIIAGMLMLVLGLASTPARAQLTLEVMGGYYGPNLGKINEDFDQRWNDLWGHDFEFRAGMMYGLALRYDLGPRFGLRLEGYSFESKTGETYYHSWESSRGFREHYHDDDFKLTVTPIVLSGIYKFPPFYIGTGVGSFSTKLQWTGEYDEYKNRLWTDRYSLSESDNDSSTGLVLLAGFSFGGKPVFLNLEARYVVGTKAKLEVAWWDTWDTEVDLSGLQFSLLAGFKF